MYRITIEKSDEADQEGRFEDIYQQVLENCNVPELVKIINSAV